MKQEEKENNPKYLQLCPERIVEPTCRRPSPSGLCLSLWRRKRRRNRPLQSSSFLKGKIYLINWPTPESNWLFFGGWGKEPSPAAPWGGELGFLIAVAPALRLSVCL